MTNMHSDLVVANGHLHVAQWLIDLGKQSNSLINIHADDEYAFRMEL